MPFRLLVDLETTGEPLLIPPPISAPPIELPGSNPSQLLVVDDRLFFAADDRSHGAELWTTDGTVDGTRLVADLCPGTCSSAPLLLGALDGRVVFWADDGERGFRLWRTDGTPSGTSFLADACAGSCVGTFGGSFSWLRPFAAAAAVAGGRLYFAAREPETGRELWQTDGTPGGTRRVSDICDGSCHALNFDGSRVALGDRVLFWADDGRLGWELWATDGVATWLVGDLCPGPEDGYNLGGLLAVGDRVILGSRCGSTAGALWATDGTPGGTEVLARLPRDLRDRVPWVMSLVSLEHGRALVHLQFFASSHPNLLWTTDGTPDGTVSVFGELPDSFRPMVRFGRRAALVAGGELWVTDGRPGGTRRFDGVRVTGAVGAAGSWLLFQGVDDDRDRRGLYAFNGTKPPRLISGLEVGSGLDPELLETAVLPAGLLIPAFADVDEGAELWITPWRGRQPRRPPRR